MKSLWRLFTKSQTDKPSDRVKRRFEAINGRCESCGAAFNLNPLYAAYESFHHEDDEKPRTSRLCEICLGRYDWSGRS